MEPAIILEKHHDIVLKYSVQLAAYSLLFYHNFFYQRKTVKQLINQLTFHPMLKFLSAKPHIPQILGIGGKKHTQKTLGTSLGLGFVIT